MAGDYELVPLEEVKKLQDEIERLKKEKSNNPVGGMVEALEHLANNLEGLFKIFDVAATEVEKDKIHEQSFEEKIQPIHEKLRDLERQNKDIADGMLALVDLVKGKKGNVPPPLSKQPSPGFSRPPNQGNSLPPMQESMDMPPLGKPDLPPPITPEESELPPPPDKKGFLDRFK